MKQLIGLIFVMLCFVVNGQETVPDITKVFISNSIQGKTSPDQIKKLDAFSLQDILRACEKQLADSSAGVKKAVYELVYLMSSRKMGEPEINRAVNLLIDGCRDKNTGIAYTNLKYLRYFPSNAFDPEARIKLGQLARTVASHYDMVVRLTGLAGISDLMYDYSEMLRQKKYPDNKTRWALHLALARLGDKDEAGYCLTKVKSVPVSDDVVYDLLPDLAYTRTKAAFDYMLDIISSNEKSCSSSNPDSDAKIICAYRVIKIVAPYINNFPVKVDNTGDLIAVDYNQMLITVRQWIATNKSIYTLNSDIY